MNDTFTIGENKGVIRVLDIIPVESVRGLSIDEFDQFPMYEFLSEGVIKQNPGRKRSRHDIIFYDVTRASNDFKVRYGDLISELEVHKIIGERKVQSDSPIAARITTIMRLDRIYPTLDRTELAELGSDFVAIRNTDAGIRIVPIITTKGIPDNMCLRIDSSNLSNSLLARISEDITELLEKPNGLYQENDFGQGEKEM